MNSEMYVTGNDCYGSEARAIFSLSLLLCISLRWCNDQGLEGSDMHIKMSKRGEVWSTCWQFMMTDVNSISLRYSTDLCLCLKKKKQRKEKKILPQYSSSVRQRLDLLLWGIISKTKDNCNTVYTENAWMQENIVIVYLTCWLNWTVPYSPVLHSTCQPSIVVWSSSDLWHKVRDCPVFIWTTSNLMIIAPIGGKYKIWLKS